MSATPAPLPPRTGRLSSSNGGALTLDAQGNITAELPVIMAVGIANLADVQSHEIVRIVGSTSHHVRFFGGGELRYVYNTRGEVIELSAFKVKVSLSADHRFVFMPFRPKS